MRRTTTSYIMNVRDGRASTFFPEGFDTSNLVEITRLENRWAEFLDLATGEVVCCETFFNQAQALL